MTYLACSLLFLGFATLCVSMSRHHSQLFNKRHPNPTLLLGLRYSGFALLLVSVYCYIAVYGVGNGLALWFLMATMSVILVVLLLSLANESHTAS